MQGAGLEVEQLYTKYKDDERFSHMRTSGVNFVPGQGPLHPTVMLIGEAPGKTENAKKIPFVGTAGSILNELLVGVGLNPREIYLTNIVKYLPKDETGTIRPPTDEEMEASRGYIQKEIDLVDPLVIGLCGRIPLKTLFPDHEVVLKYHGHLLEGRYVPLYHPAYLSYHPERREMVEKGYKKLKRYAVDLEREAS